MCNSSLAPLSAEVPSGSGKEKGFLSSFGKAAQHPATCLLARALM